MRGGEVARRMTDTEKWKRPWFDSLPTVGKLVWLYLLDNCDHAGVWPANFRLMSATLGESVTQERFEGWFGDKVRRIEDKYFIPSFVEFQYPTGLNPENRAHKGVISIVERISSYINEAPPKPLPSTSQGAKDKVKDKDTSSLKSDAPQNEALRSAIDACARTWLETLNHLGIERASLYATELRSIGEAIRRFESAEQVDQALFGARFEAKTDSFDPAKHAKLARVFDKDKITKFVNLAAANRPKEPKYFRPEEDASA